MSRWLCIFFDECWNPSCGFQRRYIPTKNNWEIWKLEKEINSMILKVVKERAAANYEKDLLQIILEGAKSYGDQESFPSDVSLDRFIVDNCKAIYFASHETTAITASWCLMLLAANQEWQARARAEVLEICKNNLPDADMLRNMKTVSVPNHMQRNSYKS